MFGATSTFTPAVNNPNKSVLVPQGPSDTVSSLQWSPNGTSAGEGLLACSSWDNTVRVWEVKVGLGRQPTFTPKCCFTHTDPILSCCLTKNNMLLAAGCDSQVKMHCMATSQSQTIGQHTAPVCFVSFYEEKSLCVSVGWDSVIKFWDGRSPSAVAESKLSQKPVCCDMKNSVLAVALMDRNIPVYNLTSGTQPGMTLTPPQKMQLRAVSIYPDMSGLAVGSIEARCSVMHFQDAKKHANFSFKCHRAEDKSRSESVLYPVNGIDFHPTVTSVFVTAGSDGTMVTWERVQKQKLKGFLDMKEPITAVKFDPSGNFLAYAAGYDWSKGFANADPTKYPTNVFVHVLEEDAVKVQPKSVRR